MMKHHDLESPSQRPLAARLTGLALTAVLTASACLLASAPSTAHAQADEDEQARTLFLAGRTYFEQGEYELAYDQFLRAYELSGRPELLLNISMSAERSGEFEEAAARLQEFIDSDAEISDRPTLDRRLAALRRRAEEKREEEARIQAQLAEAEAAESEDGEDETVSDGAPPAAADEGGISTGAIIGLSVGGAGVALFGIFGALTLAEDGSLADGCGATRSCSDDDLSSLRTYTILADIGIGLAVVGAALGTYFLIAGGGDDDEDEGESVSLVPLFDPRGAGGAMVEGRF